MISLINVKFKSILYDDVGKKDIFPITFRSLQGTVVNIINFTAAKYISSAIVGVVNQLSQVCCVVMCYFLLGETLSRKEIIFLALIVVCIIDIVVFAPSDPTNTSNKSITQLALLYLALFINPFLTAGGTIAMRKVGKLHEYVISFWLNLTTLFINLAIVYAFGGQNFKQVLNNFDGVCWFYTVLTGIFTIMQ